MAHANMKKNQDLSSSHGGRRTGAGRPRGKRNKKTAEQMKAVEASGMTPLDYLLSVIRDDAHTINERMDAAKAAAPYVHPKLSNISANVDATIGGYDDIIRLLAAHGDA
jgi:hypothetical protein